MRTHYSFNQLKTASDCGLRYHKKYVIGDERGSDSLEQVAGKILHAAYQHHDLGTYKTADQLVQYCRNELQEFEGFRDLPRTAVSRNWEYWLSEGFGTHIQNFLGTTNQFDTPGMSGWKDWETWFEPSWEQSTEVEFELDIGLEFPIKGYIDRVYFNSDKKLIVRDYKTGAPRASDAIQVDQYAVIYEELHGCDVDFSELVYTRGSKAEVVTVPRSLDFDQLVSLYDGLEEVRYSSPLIQGPFNGACKHCDFRNTCTFSNAGEKNTVELPDILEAK